MILSPKDLLHLPGLKLHSERSAYRLYQRVKLEKGRTERHHRISLRELAEYLGVDKNDLTSRE